ncbi:MAG: hypothetical protein JSS83_04765 [Cyanobacteria bacterium SZAS LIN-3]|nr:hypothetical protein [Cyanobacteria bacterium SZAS LIN-3]
MADETRNECKVENVLAGAAKGQDTVTKFNTDCSLQERREFLNTLQTQGKSTDASHGGTHAAAMLGGFKIEYDSVKRTLDSIQGPPGTNTHAAGHGAEATHGTAKAKPGDAGRKPEAHTQPASAPDTGRPGIDDQYTRLTRENLSTSEREAARKIEKALLNGDNVSATINGLDRDAKVRVMSEVKGHLAEQPGTKVSVSDASGIDGTRYITMETAKGQKLLISESRMGIPHDVIYNGGGIMSRITGTSDLYDRPGETKPAEVSSGPSWRDRLLGKPLSEGNGPLARMQRGESITAEEEAELRKKGLIYDPMEKPGR